MQAPSLSLGKVLAELRVSFPQDALEATRLFAAALIREAQGNKKEAESFLNKAIAAEAQSK